VQTYTATVTQLQYITRGKEHTIDVWRAGHGYSVCVCVCVRVCVCGRCIMDELIIVINRKANDTRQIKSDKSQSRDQNKGLQQHTQIYVSAAWLNYRRNNLHTPICCYLIFTSVTYYKVWYAMLFNVQHLGWSTEMHVGIVHRNACWDGPQKCMLGWSTDLHVGIVHRNACWDRPQNCMLGWSTDLHVGIVHRNACWDGLQKCMLGWSTEIHVGMVYRNAC